MWIWFRFSNDKIIDIQINCAETFKGKTERKRNDKLQLFYSHSKTTRKNKTEKNIHKTKKKLTTDSRVFFCIQYIRSFPFERSP